MRKNKFIKIFSLFLVIIFIIMFWSDKTIIDASKDRLYNDVNLIPRNKVGLLLGTGKYASNGDHNTYYDNRIAAAAKLINEGKIKYLIISGDNSRKDYNEPDSMFADLRKLGIDSSLMFLDYAGFRTFDSVERLKKVFGQDTVTIISQQFHNERAIYTAFKENIYAIGYNAKDVDNSIGITTQIREKFARVKVILDFWFGNQPKYLGNKITIPN